MIEWLGLLYTIAKDLKEYGTCDEEEKLIDSDWLEKSGFKDELQSKGMTPRWSNPDKVASRQLDGWDIIYEIDGIRRIRRKLVLRDGMILIGKRS